MEFKAHSFRHAGVILEQFDFANQFHELIGIIKDISDEDIISQHQSYGVDNLEKTPKSLSKAINDLLKQRFTEKGWIAESPIFQDTYYKGDNWRLDFAKKDISLEVAFNHASVIAWNLTKPVLASELNHVQKAIQTKIGVLITATNDMKSKGGFDSAIGTYEKFLDYLPPLRNFLTTPLLIIGLEAPQTFYIEEHQYKPRKRIGRVVMK